MSAKPTENYNQNDSERPFPGFSSNSSVPGGIAVFFFSLVIAIGIFCYLRISVPFDEYLTPSGAVSQVFQVLPNTATEDSPDPAFMESKTQNSGISPVPEGPRLSIAELQNTLVDFDGESDIVGIGGYVINPEDRELLQPLIDARESHGLRVGFVMVDIHTGQGVAYNADKEFYSASSYKGIYVASLVAARPELILERKNTFSSIVRDSDNELYDSLYASYGKGPMLDWCEQSGVDAAVAKWCYVDYSPRELSKLWVRNYEYFCSGAENIDTVTSWYSSPRVSAINKHLGDKYATSSKAGYIGEDGYYATNDAGIVYVEGRPYIMVVMTNASGDFSSINSIVVALNEMHDRVHVRSKIQSL